MQRPLANLLIIVPLLLGLSIPSAHARPPKEPTVWTDATTLTVEGRGFPVEELPSPWSRLPQSALDHVTSDVRVLSRNTAGICIRFIATSAHIAAEWDGGVGMNHMAPSGSNGLDLYMRESDGSWTYKGTGRPNATRTSSTLASGLPKGRHEYLLYLPTYSNVTSLRIGIAPGATIAPAKPRAKTDRPIVFYGTSITQGGCASRAGMGHAAILGRWLDRQVINLGFSGAGKSEPIMAELLARIDASLYILEPLPNMTLEQTQTRIIPFVQILRKARPQVPIILVENPLYPSDAPLNVALRQAMTQLRRQGITNLHLIKSGPQLAGQENGTVDGVHPTDLGFYRMAVAYRPVLRRLLATAP